MANAATITHEKLDATREVISIEGDIASDDLEQFRQLSLRYPKAVVYLNSRGGLVQPAIEIGKIIRFRGYATVVFDDDVCTSACALIWIAGSKRSLSERGHIGFHASYYNSNGKAVESGVANALVGNYLTLLGLPTKAIVFATTAPPDSVLWLTTANREATGIDFGPPMFDDLPSVWGKQSPSPIQPVPLPAASQQPMLAPRPAPPHNEQNTNLSRPLRPLTNPAQWVSWGDFPYKALGVSGELSPNISLAVGVSVDVNSSGRVLRCRVIASSGLPALDDATCRAISQRAAFIPATDPAGNTVAARYINTIRWK